MLAKFPTIRYYIEQLQIRVVMEIFVFLVTYLSMKDTLKYVLIMDYGVWFLMKIGIMLKLL